MIASPDTTARLVQAQVIQSMEPFVAEQLGALLKPVEESWQPTDWLPDLGAMDWQEQLREFRERAQELPDEVLVVLVGDMVTEEALPSYQTWLNRLRGLGTPLARVILPGRVGAEVGLRKKTGTAICSTNTFT